jgi:hypothetical protein
VLVAQDGGVRQVMLLSLLIVLFYLAWFLLGMLMLGFSLWLLARSLYRLYTPCLLGRRRKSMEEEMRW